MATIHPAATTIEIHTVVTSAQNKMFLDVPAVVHAQDMRWVAPLRRDEAARFRPDNAFFQHGSLQRFVALRQENGKSQAVGRIAAAVNRRLVEQEGPVGLVGFFECIEDFTVAQALLDAACDWLRQQDMTQARSSIDFSAANNCAFLVDGFDSSPMLLMPYNPAYYPALLERAGWRGTREAYAYTLPLDETLFDDFEATFGAGFRRASEEGITFRPIHTGSKAFRQDCLRCYELAFERLGFEGPEREEFVREMSIVRMPIIGQRDGCILAEDGDKLVGVLIALPDYNIPLKHLRGRLSPLGIFNFLRHLSDIDQVRLILLGVLPEYRRQAVAMALIYKLGQWGKTSQGRRYQRAEISWVYEDNPSSQALCEMAGAEITKTYRVFEKEL